MIERLRRALAARLIPDWRLAWRLWSIRLSAFAAATMTTIYAWPDGALLLWNMMPVQLQLLLPAGVGQPIAALLFGAVIVMRLVKQKDAGPRENGQ